MKVFHAYDIRGIYNKDFNKDDVYKIGYFLPRLLKTDRILVGRDVRLSSPEVFEFLCKGIVHNGADVYDLGLSTTPMVYFATAKHHFDGSVMITASHNGKEYNGLKVSRQGAMPVGYENGLKELENLIKTGEVIVAEAKGKVITYNILAEYITFLKSYLPDISNLNLTIDCSNGMAALFIKEILGNSPHYLFDELNGNFPNHAPNPLVMENIMQLQAAVIQNRSDAGIIFDGDADRVMFVDENGKFIPPDLMIAVMAPYFLEKHKSKKPLVIHDIRTSKSVIEHIEKLGGTPYMWKVGRAFAALKLREIDGLFGGELAGHYYFKDFYYSDSGVLACLIVLQTISRLKSEGKRISELIASISKYSNSGEVNFTIESKSEAMQALKEYFTDNENVLHFYDFDGYRIEFAEWWFNIRPSNTEPYLRLLVEAKTEIMLEEKLQLIKSILADYIINSNSHH